MNKVQFLGLPSATQFSSAAVRNELIGKLLVLARSQKKKSQVYVVTKARETFDNSPGDFLYALGVKKDDAVRIIPLQSQQNFFIASNGSAPYWFNTRSGLPLNAAVTFDEVAGAFSLGVAPRGPFTQDLSAALNEALDPNALTSIFFPGKFATALALRFASALSGTRSSLHVEFDRAISIPGMHEPDTTQPTQVNILHSTAVVVRDPETLIPISTTTTYVGRIYGGAGVTAATSVVSVNGTDFALLPGVGRFHPDTLVTFTVNDAQRTANIQTYDVPLTIEEATLPAFTKEVGGMTLTFTNLAWFPELVDIAAGVINYNVTGSEADIRDEDESVSISTIDGPAVGYFREGSAGFISGAPGRPRDLYSRSTYREVTDAIAQVSSSGNQRVVTMQVTVNIVKIGVSGGIAPTAYGFSGYSYTLSNGAVVNVAQDEITPLYAAFQPIQATVLSSTSISAAVTGSEPQLLGSGTRTEFGTIFVDAYSAHPSFGTYVIPPTTQIRISIIREDTVHVNNSAVQYFEVDADGRAYIQSVMIPYMLHKNIVEEDFATVPPAEAGHIVVSPQGTLSVLPSPRYDAQEAGNGLYDYEYVYKSVYRYRELPKGYRRMNFNFGTTPYWGWGRFTNLSFTIFTHQQTTFKGEAGAQAVPAFIPSPTVNFEPPSDYAFSFHDVLRDLTVFRGTIQVDGSTQYKFDIGGRIFTRTCLYEYQPFIALPLEPSVQAPLELNIGFVAITGGGDFLESGEPIFSSFEKLTGSYINTVPANNLYPLLSVSLYLPSNQILFWSWTPKSHIEPNLLDAIMRAVQQPLSQFTTPPAQSWPGVLATWAQYQSAHNTKVSELQAQTDLTDAERAYEAQEFALAQLESAIEPLYKTSGAGDIDLRYLVSGQYQANSGSVAANYHSIVYVYFDMGDWQVNATDLLQHT